MKRKMSMLEKADKKQGERMKKEDRAYGNVLRKQARVGNYHSPMDNRAKSHYY